MNFFKKKMVDHKFVLLMDNEAFRYFMDDSGTVGKLVEMQPNKWVLGRYDNDMTLLHELETMKTYTVK